ncbi:perakine reductase-like [Olea europaea subsp. europaea]|uniref:Perakine reductase-like n=1 Tax=Olea europaea subsp. europaea TaxID=158383 RepID=A0A8S0SEJ3_OLEEU|nr:perakine reductase-like [Olea europaea subsp. europaea]
MAEQVEMPRVKLGKYGLEVSKLGYGCMGLTGAYNNPLPEEEGIAVIKEAFSKGITFFDTSNLYGLNYANEYLVGKVISQILIRDYGGTGKCIRWEDTFSSSVVIR